MKFIILLLLSLNLGFTRGFSAPHISVSHPHVSVPHSSPHISVPHTTPRYSVRPSSPRYTSRSIPLHTTESSPSILTHPMYFWHPMNIWYWIFHHRTYNECQDKTTWDKEKCKDIK